MVDPIYATRILRIEACAIKSNYSRQGRKPIANKRAHASARSLRQRNLRLRSQLARCRLRPHHCRCDWRNLPGELFFEVGLLSRPALQPHAASGHAACWEGDLRVMSERMI